MLLQKDEMDQNLGVNNHYKASAESLHFFVAVAMSVMLAILTLEPSGTFLRILYSLIYQTTVDPVKEYPYKGIAITVSSDGSRYAIYLTDFTFNCLLTTL